MILTQRVVVLFWTQITAYENFEPFAIKFVVVLVHHMRFLKM